MNFALVENTVYHKEDVKAELAKQGASFEDFTKEFGWNEFYEGEDVLAFLGY